VWQETLSTLAAQFHLLLPCSLAGAATNGLIAWLLALHLAGIYQFLAYVASVLSLTFVRGVIVGIGLQAGHVQPARARDLCRRMARRWPALVISSVLYSALMVSGAGHRDEARQWLHAQLDDTVAATKPASIFVFMNAVAQREAGLQLVDALLPGPGQPYEDWLAHRDDDSMPDSAAVLSNCRSGAQLAYPCASSSTPPSAPAGPESILIFCIVETLLCFSTTAACQPRSTASGWREILTWLLPLGESVCLVVRRFWHVTAHIWLLRIVIATVSVLPSIVPPALVRSALAPIYGAIIASVPGIAGVLTTSATLAVALTSALLLTLRLIYEARLYSSLIRQDGPQSRPVR
jgi:hypothetical protein